MGLWPIFGILKPFALSPSAAEAVRKLEKPFALSLSKGGEVTVVPSGQALREPQDRLIKRRNGTASVWHDPRGRACRSTGDNRREKYLYTHKKQSLTRRRER